MLGPCASGQTIAVEITNQRAAGVKRCCTAGAPRNRDAGERGVATEGGCLEVENSNRLKVEVDGWTVSASVLSVILLNPQNSREEIILTLVTEHKVDEVNRFAHSPHSLKEFG